MDLTERMMIMINKIITIIDKCINCVLLIVFIFIMSLGIYAIYDFYKVKDSAQLSDDIISLKPQKNKVAYSFSDIKKINQDIVAWITINDTFIDYPIVVGEDNTEYLDKNYKKDFSITGSIFLDYRNKHDFSDDYSVIYGHNMKADVMFSDIKKYENPEFFNSHLVGTLYNETNTYKLEIICFSKVNAYENDVFNVISFGNNSNNKVLKFLKSKSIFKRDIPLNSDDKLLLLSTCDEANPNERNVILTKMSVIDSDSNLKVSMEQDDSNDNNKASRIKNIEEKRYVQISLRNIFISALFVIVIIIFTVLIIKKIKINLKNKK